MFDLKLLITLIYNKIFDYSKKIILVYAEQIQHAKDCMSSDNTFTFNGCHYQFDSVESNALKQEISECESRIRPLCSEDLSFKSEFSEKDVFDLVHGQLTPAALALDFPRLTPKEMYLKKQNLRRYSDIYAPVDKICKDYNGNIDGHLGLFEGPYEQEENNSLISFIDALKTWGNVNKILVLGPAYENNIQKHYPYNINSSVKEISCDINQYSYDDYEVFHFHAWTDHGITNLHQNSIDWLYETLCNNTQENIAIHCSAGVGRTGTLAFAYQLFNEYDTIFVADNQEETAANIVRELISLRRIRAFLVQNPRQISMALTLADQFKALALANKSENITEVASFDNEPSKLNATFSRFRR